MAILQLEVKSSPTIHIFLKKWYSSTDPHTHNHNFFSRSATSSPQLFKEMLLHNCARAYGSGSQWRPNECIFGSGKPWGVGILGGRVYEPGEGKGKLVYEQPGNEVDGSCHSKEGSK